MVVSSSLSFKMVWQCQNHVKSHPGPHTPLLPDTTPPDFLFSQCEIPRGSFNSLWSIVSMSRMVQVALPAVLSGQLKHTCSAFARPWVQLPVVENKERNQKKWKRLVLGLMVSLAALRRDYICFHGSKGTKYPQGCSFSILTFFVLTYLSDV